MSVYSGPEIANDGLVFAYDMNNPQKSWRGAPVVNLALNTDYSNRSYNTAYDIGGFGGDDADVFYYNSGGYNNLPYKKMVKHTGGTGGSYINEHGYFTLVEGTTYIITCYMKSNIPTTVSGHTLALNRDADNAYRVPADIVLTTDWVKQSWIYTCAVGEGGTTYLFRQIVYNDTSLPVEVYWSGLQISVGTISYPYVNGTRSNTQAILDFTNNNTITANSLTYAANNTFSFNGTNSFCAISDTSTLSFESQQFTFDYWVYFNNTTSLNGIIGKGEGSWEYSIYANGTNGLIFYSWPTSGAGPVYSPPHTTTFAAGQWYHHCWTANGTNSYLYINGALISTNNKSAYNLGNGTSRVTIGAAGDAGGLRYLNGSLSNLKIYNRALSASEIQQNFNATRGRYGI